MQYHGERNGGREWRIVVAVGSSVEGRKQPPNVRERVRIVVAVEGKYVNEAVLMNLKDFHVS